MSRSARWLDKICMHLTQTLYIKDPIHHLEELLIIYKVNLLISSDKWLLYKQFAVYHYQGQIWDRWRTQTKVFPLSRREGRKKVWALILSPRTEIRGSHDDTNSQHSFFYLRRSQAGQWMIFGFRKICPIQPFRGQSNTGTWVIEVTEFKFEVRSDLWGHMEAAMASEATKLAVTGNMHIGTRVIEVACVKSEIKLDL